jgi:hypothetical protein
MAVQRLLRLLPTDSFLGAAYGAAVKVPKEAGEAEAGKLVWIQAAYEGDFKGYRFPMKLTAGFFKDLVDNLRRDPQFKAGADGYGTEPVVRMDYEHASAMPPTEGNIPSQGAPAPGWVCDLETRPGKDKAGNPRLDLWALCSLGETLRGQIKAEEYLFTSIDAPLKSKDPVTGEERGPKLRALAMTNDPFLRDLEPARIAASMSVWGKATTVEELVAGLRQALELPDTATTDEIKTNLESVFVAFQNGVRPPGCPDGLGFVIDGVRRLLGLPLLTTAEQIMVAAGQALEAASSSPVSTPLQPAQPQESAAMTTPSTPDTMRARLVELLGVVDHPDAILAAAAKGSNAIGVLDAMLKTYGATDYKDLVAKATVAHTAAGKAVEVGTKMSELLASIDGEAKAESDQEAEQIAASSGMAADAPQRKGYVAFIASEGLAARRAKLGIAVGDDGKTLTLCDKQTAKFESFRATYPLPTADQQKRVLLTTPIVAGSGGAQLGGAHTNLPAGGAGAGEDGPEHLKVLEEYPGANPIAKAIAMLSDKRAGFAKFDWATQNRLANNYVLTGKAA